MSKIASRSKNTVAKTQPVVARPVSTQPIARFAWQLNNHVGVWNSDGKRVGQVNWWTHVAMKTASREILGQLMAAFGREVPAMRAYQRIGD